MWNAGLDEAQTGLKIAGRNINNLRYTDDTTLMVESEEELKSLLMKVKEESEKVDLKLNIQKTKIMASSPTTLWRIDGETMETVRDFIFLGSKITADVDFSHEMKRHLLLGRKAMTNLDSILKSRDITLLTKVHLVKAAFPVAMYGCAAAAAKSFQLCPTLCNPVDGSSTGFPVPGILQARTPEWVAISFSNAWKVKVKSFSCVRLLATAWTAAYQTPPSTGFTRQEYWNGVPLHSPDMYAVWTIF